MSQEEKNCVGIWMDHKKAIFITKENGEFAIDHKVEADAYHGHKGEHIANNAKRSGDRKYHKAMATALQKYDEIYLFGPGTSQEELQNFLHEDQHFKYKKITLGTAGHITDPQMVAQVREFFK